MKVLFFAPHSAIWVHAFPEALIAKTLKQAGHEVIYVGCGKVYDDICVSMSAFHLSFESTREEKDAICDQCVSNCDLIRKTYGFDGLMLADLITREMEREVDSMISGFDEHQILDYRFDGVPLAKFALYQVSITYKVLSVDSIRLSYWEEYLAEFRYVLLTWLAAKKLFDDVQPDRIITYNSLYAVNRTMAALAVQRGIPDYFLHAGGNLSNRLETLMIGRGNSYGYIDQVKKQWTRFRDQPIGKGLIDQVLDHQKTLISGDSIFVYSTAVGESPTTDIRAYFGVKEGQQVLLATMSSYDERLAAELVEARRATTTSYFPTQIDWIKWLTQFVAKSQDLFLIIRVHPREFPNNREKKLSEHAQALQKAFEDLPSNARINWPTDKISIYDLALHVDVVLNSWSTVGQHMSLLGVPVVLYSSDLTNYPADLNYFGDNEADYASAIDQALQDGWSFERARAAFRWTALELQKSVIHLGDQYTGQEHALSLSGKIMSKVLPGYRSRKWQQMDIKKANGKLAEGDEVVTIIADALHSVAEVRDPHSDEDFAAETNHLQDALRRIATLLDPNADESRKSSKLISSLQQP